MTTATCSKTGCQQLQDCRGLCAKHYRYTLHTGQFGYRDAGPVLEHLGKLRASGWTWLAIANAAGLDVSGVRKLARSRNRRVLPETHRRVLAIPVIPFVARRAGVDPTGTRRRLQALMWMGWTGEEISRRAGLQGHSLQCLVSGNRRCSRDAAQRVAAVYEELSHRTGPSRMTAGRAHAAGYAPPMAWDDIDNPRERPKGLRKGAA